MVLTRLRDFSCKTSTFDECKLAEQSTCNRTDRVTGGSRLDIESALAWLRRELVRQLFTQTNLTLYYLYYITNKQHG